MNNENAKTQSLLPTVHFLAPCGEMLFISVYAFHDRVYYYLVLPLCMSLSLWVFVKCTGTAIASMTGVVSTWPHD